MTQLKFPSIDRHEWRWVGWFTALLIVLTCIPFAYTALTGPAGGIYTGIHVLAPGDYPVYFTYIQAAADGALVFQDLFTTEPHVPFNLNIVWVPIGWLAAIFSLTPLWAFHLARVLAIIPFALVVYTGLAWLFADVQRRRLAFLIILFAAGTGGWWAPLLQAILGSGVTPDWWPMDLWVAEAFPVLSAYQTPHFTIGTTLLLLIFGGTLLAWRSDQKRWSVLAGVSGLALMAFHPFHLPTIALVLFVWAALAIWQLRLPWQRVVKHGLIVAMLMIPTTLGQVLLSLWNPIAKGRADQNILLTTHWPITLVSYGWLFVGAVWALRRRQAWRDARWLLLGAWAITQSLLLYAPGLFFQRRLTQGLMIPMAILTAVAIVEVWSHIKKRWPSFADFAGTTRVIQVFAFLLVFGLSPIVIAGQDFSYPHGVVAEASPQSFYFTSDMRPIVATLKQSPTDSIFLASPATSNALVGLTQRRGYISHTVETLRFEEKTNEVRAILNTATEREQAEWFRSHNIQYLVWGKWERYFYPEFDPALKPFLKLVHSGTTNSLYQLR